MQLEFNCISELGEPGLKFKKLFDKYWPEYKYWLDTNSLTYLPDLETSVAALQHYMPEMIPIYHKICELVNADNYAAQFLTGFQPPPYLSACSQAVLAKDDIQLVRNYDFHHSLLEGTVFMSTWHGKKVIVNSDCLLGAIDGMNENGLAISLTFGGRKIVGNGFGIPFILRYVLEFCDTVDEALSALSRIPSHMAYNVTVVDKTGRYKTILLSPDNPPVITSDAFTTNHQIKIDWLANAKFNKTVERAKFLEELLGDKNLNAQTLSNAFLKKPLYNNLFTKGFGTLYTVDYRPSTGTVLLRWLEDNIVQTFDDFREVSVLIKYYDPTINSTKHTFSSNSSDEFKNMQPKNNIGWILLTEYSKQLKVKIKKFNYNKK